MTRKNLVWLNPICQLNNYLFASIDYKDSVGGFKPKAMGFKPQVLLRPKPVSDSLDLHAPYTHEDNQRRGKYQTVTRQAWSYWGG